MPYSVGVTLIDAPPEVEPEPSEPWIPADTFGARLALIRQRLHLNIKSAATHAGIGAETWRKWEQDVAPRGMETVARKIATAFCVDYVWLMTGEIGPNAIRTCLLQSPSVEGVEQLRLPLEGC